MPPLPPTGTRPRRWDALATWSHTVAAVVAVFGVADLVRWGNRWYVSEVFAEVASADGEAGWRFAFHLLHAAHEALVRGILLCVVAALLVGLARWARRRSRLVPAT